MTTLYEWTAELDEGWAIPSGEPWRGHRIRYRPEGTRRWRTFLLSTDDGKLPTDALVLRAIEAHAAS